MARILITGGTGKTGKRLAARLDKDRVRVASRHPSPGGVVFDWTEPQTFDAVLAEVGAIYLVAPTRHGEEIEAMKPFLSRALSQGVRRFVLLSASLLPEGGPLMGRVHAFLHQNAPEWAVLRPSWFMQDFTEGYHFPTIRNAGVIYSATGDGVVPFIDAEDIASVAAALLLASSAPNRDVVLTGPRPISYDEVARLLSAAAGRRIEHCRISEVDLAGRWLKTGLPEGHARVLAAMDVQIARGAENRVTDDVASIAGRPPRNFEASMAQHAGVWQV